MGGTWGNFCPHLLTPRGWPILSTHLWTGTKPCLSRYAAVGWKKVIRELAPAPHTRWGGEGAARNGGISLGPHLKTKDKHVDGNVLSVLYIKANYSRIWSRCMSKSLG